MRKLLLSLVAIFGLLVTQIPLEAWALVKLWGWFVTPAFNLPVPALPHMAGLAAFATLLTFRLLKTEEGMKALATAYITPPLFVLGGWVLTWLM